MVIHPPMLYAGYVGFTVPFAFAVAADHRAGRRGLVDRDPPLDPAGVGLLVDRHRARRLVELRGPGLGRVLGVGPGRERVVPPVACATAFIHSVMVQERRGMLRVWNLSLVLATFSLTILGTFLTRSGVIDSVHSFTESISVPGSWASSSPWCWWWGIAPLKVGIAMRHGNSGKKLGRDSADRKALYSNLAGALIEHGRIKTTVTKAKAVKPLAEQMITLGRRGDLHARRQATAFLRSRDVVHHLFAEIAPRFKDRPGGYTRIIKLGPRPGDRPRWCISARRRRVRAEGARRGDCDCDSSPGCGGGC